MDTLSILGPSTIMGLGIAVDVAIATVARFRDRSMTFKNWTLPVSLAHIVLPAFGYYSWWYLGHEFQGLAFILGLVAFSMITVFIYESICEWADLPVRLSLAPLTDWIFQRLEDDSKGKYIVILAVSLDALWSGPAKAAQAQSAHWTPMEVFVSFFIAGAVVAMVAELALLLAYKLRSVNFSNSNSLARYLVIGKYAEATVLFSFGLLSLWNAFAYWIGLGNLTYSMVVSAALMLIVWTAIWNRLFSTQATELQEVSNT